MITIIILGLIWLFGLPVFTFLVMRKDEKEFPGCAGSPKFGAFMGIIWPIWVPLWIPILVIIAFLNWLGTTFSPENKSLLK